VTPNPSVEPTPNSVAAGVGSPQTLGRAELKLMCYPPLRSRFMPTIALRSASSVLEVAVMSGPASGRPVLNEAARGRNLFNFRSAHVLRRSQVAIVALNELPLGASWSCSAGIAAARRAHRPVAVRAPGTFFKHFAALQKLSSQGSAAQKQARFSTGLAGGIQGYSGASPARPNPSVEPTPNRVAPWPGSGYQVHSPLPGQGATLSGSSHLKR
jgi:hypothetical protein